LTNSDKIQYWFDLAEEDLSIAKVVLDANKLIHSVFMCHQTIEKALKGIISQYCLNDEIPPKIHHLPKLAERAKLYALMSVEQQEFIKELTPMNVESRYPEYKKQIEEGLSDAICKEIYVKTEELLCWLKAKL